MFQSLDGGVRAACQRCLALLHAPRLAWVIRAAETVAHFRWREERFDGPKPAFGEFERAMGEEWVDEGPTVVSGSRVTIQEVLQGRYGEGGGPEGAGLVPWVR